MLGYPAALGIIAAACAPLPARRARPAEALGAVAAADVRAAGPLPAFANAAMDGYALRSADTAGATPARPVRLALAGRVPAGAPPPGATAVGTAWQVMTGALMPGGCDAVVPVERARAGAGFVELDAPLEPGRNRREAGEDYAGGDRVLAAGDRVTPEAVMALAAVGCEALAVRGPARVAILATGDELAGGPAGVRDANGPYLEAALPGLGGSVASRGAVGDDPAALAAAIEAAARGCDVLLTTGGVSAGALDYVPGAIARLGGEVLFHKVAIRPGKPLLCARLPGGALVLGLPGNPVAAAVGLRFFVAPALRALAGLPPERLARARLAAPVRNRRGLTFFAKAVVTAGADATLAVRVLPGQESFRIAPLVAANGWAIVPEGTEEVPAGTPVAVAPLVPGAFPPGAG